MDTDTIQALSGRLDRMERENRLWRRVAVAVLCGGFAFVALGTNLLRASREVSAERFVLKDEHGRSRALLAMKPGESPAFVLLDEMGQDQVVLRGLADGSSSLEYYEGKAVKATIGTKRGLGSYLSLQNRGKRNRSEMFLWDDGTAGIGAGVGLRGVSMQVQPDGRTKLGFADKRGRERFGIGMDRDGTMTRNDAADLDGSAADGTTMIPAVAPAAATPEQSARATSRAMPRS